MPNASTPQTELTIETPREQTAAAAEAPKPLDKNRFQEEIDKALALLDHIDKALKAGGLDASAGPSPKDGFIEEINTAFGDLHVEYQARLDAVIKGPAAKEARIKIAEEFLGRADEIIASIQKRMGHLTPDKIRVKTVAARKEEAARLAREKAEWDKNVKPYADTRADFLVYLNRPPFKSETNLPDLAAAKPGATDVITVKIGDKAVATVTMILKEGEKPELKIPYANGEKEYVRRFDNLTDMGIYVGKFNTITAIPETVILKNRAKLATAYGRMQRSLEGTPGAAGIQLEPFGEAAALLPPDENFKPAILLQETIGDEIHNIGVVEIDFSEDIPQKGRIVIGGVSLEGGLVDLQKIQETLATHQDRIQALHNKQAIARENANAIPLPAGLALGEPQLPPDLFASDASIQYPVKKGEETVATISVRTGDGKIDMSSKKGDGGLDFNIDQASRFLADHFPAEAITETAVANAGAAAGAEAPPVDTGGQPAPEGTITSAGEAPVGEKAGETTAETTDTPEGLKASVGALANAIFANKNLRAVIAASFNFETPPKSGDDFLKNEEVVRMLKAVNKDFAEERLERMGKENVKLLPREVTIVAEAVQKALSIAEEDPAEMKLVKELRTKSGLSFAAVFGPNNGLAELLSRTRTITKPETGEGIKFDEKIVIDLEGLALLLPAQKDQILATIAAADAKDKPALEAAQTALEKALKPENDRLDKIAALMKDPNKAGKPLSETGWQEALAMLAQFYGTLKAAFSGNPTDFTMLKDVMADLSGQPPVNPMDSMKTAKEGYQNFLDSARPTDIGLLLGAYAEPAGPKADELFKEGAAAAGWNEEDMKPLDRYRAQAGPLIKQYLGDQLHVKVASVNKNTETGVTTLRVYKNGQPYEMDFSERGDGAMVAQVFKLGNVPKPDPTDNKKTITELARVNRPDGTGPAEITDLSFENLIAAFNAPADAPEAPVAPPVPPGGGTEVAATTTAGEAAPVPEKKG